MKLTFNSKIPQQSGSVPGIEAPPPTNNIPVNTCECGETVNKTTTPWHCPKCFKEYHEKDGVLTLLE